MRRLLQQFFVLLLVLTVARGAYAQTQVTASDGVSNGDIIYITNTSNSIFTGTTTDMSSSLGTANALYCVEYVSDESTTVTIGSATYHQFRLQRITDGTYIPAPTGTDNVSFQNKSMAPNKNSAAIFTLEAGTVSQTTAASGTMRLRSEYNGSKTFLRLQPTWTNGFGYHAGTGDGTLLNVYKYDNVSSLVSITFSVKKDEKEVHSYTGKFIDGETYSLTAPDSFSSLSNASTTVSSTDNNTTKEVTITYNYPFTVSESTDNATWHFLTIGQAESQLGVIHDNGNDNYISLSNRDFSEADKADLWCFVGDPYNGFKLYNGNSNKVLGCGPSMHGKTGAHNLPVLYVEGSQADSISILWDIMASGDATNLPNGICLAIHDTSYRLNSRSSSDTGTGSQALAFWSGGADGGSTLQVSQTIPALTLNPATDNKSYSTLYLPYEAKVGDGVTAYYGMASDGKVKMTQFDNNIIPANQGALLVSETGASSATLTLTSTNATLPNSATNSLNGTCTAISDITKTDYYIFGQYESVVGFYRPNSTTLKANRAFIKDSNNYNSTNALRMTFDDETTTTISTAISEEPASNAQLYDLSGRAVSKPTQSGIYIKGGKKVYIK